MDITKSTTVANVTETPKTASAGRGKRMKKSKRAKYRSGLERKVATVLTRKKVDFKYEGMKIPYRLISDRTYNPDFPLYSKSGKLIIVEVKGIWDAADRKKHLLIKQQHPELDIRFVFSNSKTKIAKGSQTTYAMICNGEGRGEYKGVTWKFADKKIPQEWLDE